MSWSAASSSTVMGSGVMISLTLRPWERAYSGGQPPRADQELEPARPPTLRVGFGPTEKVAFRNHADQLAFLVDHRQAAHPPLQHDTNGLRHGDCRVRPSRPERS